MNFKNTLAYSVSLLALMGATMVAADEVEKTDKTPIKPSQTHVSVYVGIDNLFPKYPGMLNDMGLPSLHNIDHLYKNWYVDDHRKYTYDADALNLKVGEFIDTAPFFEIQDGQMPYEDFGIERLGSAKIVMKGKLSIDKEGYYYIYPLEENTPKNPDEGSDISHISNIWSGFDWWEEKGWWDDNTVSHPDDQQVPWMEGMNPEKEGMAVIRINGKEVFSTKEPFRDQMDRLIRSQGQENTLRNALTPIKLNAGEHGFEMVFYTRNEQHPASNRKNQVYERASYLDQFEGFNIHAEMIDSKEDKYLTHVFDKKSENQAVLSLQEQEVIQDEVSTVSDLKTGYIIDADIGVMDLSSISDWDSFSLPPSEAQILQFSFTAEDSGTYIFSHDIFFEMDGEFVDNPTPAGYAGVQENCVIHGTYSTVYGTTGGLGLSTDILSHYDDKEGQTRAYLDAKELLRREGAYYGGPRYADAYANTAYGSNVLLPLEVSPDLIGTEIDVTMHYTCETDMWSPGADRKVDWGDNLPYRPQILVKTPKSSGFAPVDFPNTK